MGSFSVVSNISAANAQSNLINTSANLQKAITRLSSGFRINQAGDDAAGLSLANTYRSTQAVLNQGIRNANDASVHPADQGRRAQQHQHPARPPLDPRHPVRLGQQHRRPHRAQQRVQRRPHGNHA